MKIPKTVEELYSLSLWHSKRAGSDLSKSIFHCIVEAYEYRGGYVNGDERDYEISRFVELFIFKLSIAQQTTLFSEDLRYEEGEDLGEDTTSDDIFYHLVEIVTDYLNDMAQKYLDKKQNEF